MKNLLLVFLLLITSCGAQTLQEKRWAEAYVPTYRQKAVDNIVARFLNNRARYAAVDKATGVPDYVIFGLHNMEASGSFGSHLHEGSSLKFRTRYVPVGRPKTGTPPVTWEYSAEDALKYDRMGEVKWAALDATLYACERYNGTGYLRYHPETPTPYLWAGTSVERPGKYVADSKWSSTARSQQLGIAAIWKRMEANGILNFNLLQRTTP
jgi:lysozyme family protein